MLDRKKDEESAKPAPETAPDNDDPRGVADPAYVPTPATSKPPAPGLPGMPAIPRRLADIPPISRSAGDGTVSRSENTRLSVGKDTEMSGEIKSCDPLVVEGTVDATLQNGREIQIARGGRFSGLVEVEDADISGEFSGKLVVRRRLIVCAGCPSQLFHLRQKPWNFASPSDTLSDRHKIIEALPAVFFELVVGRAALRTELLALHQQGAVLKRKRSRPALRMSDGINRRDRLSTGR